MLFNKKLLILIVALGLLQSGCSKQDDDSDAVIAKSWKVGDVIIIEPEKRGACDFISGGNYYRKFLGMTDESYYLVQDFYVRDDSPYTEPYAITNKEELMSTFFQNPERVSIHGHYVAKDEVR